MLAGRRPVILTPWGGGEDMVMNLDNAELAGEEGMNAARDHFTPNAANEPRGDKTTFSKK